IMPSVASGIVRIQPTQGGVPASANISFPPGLFQSAPYIIANARTTVPGTVLGTSAGSDSATAGRIFVNRTNTGWTDAWWSAWERGGGLNTRDWSKPQYDGTSGTVARPTQFLNSLQAAIRAGLVRVDAGLVDVSHGANQVGSAHVEFTPGRFTGNPHVFTIPNSTVPGVVLPTTAAGATAEGADIYVMRSTSGSTGVYWVALELRSTASLWTPGGPADLPGIFREFAERSGEEIPRVDAGIASINPIANQPTAAHIEFEPGLF